MINYIIGFGVGLFIAGFLTLAGLKINYLIWGSLIFAGSFALKYILIPKQIKPNSLPGE